MLTDVRQYGVEIVDPFQRFDLDYESGLEVLVLPERNG
jgi:hypothetical protein